MPWAHLLEMKLIKFGWNSLSRLKPIFFEHSASLPTLLVLTLFAAFDFAHRVIPTEGRSNSAYKSIEMPDISDDGQLANNYYQYYSQKLIDSTAAKKPEREIELSVDETPEDIEEKTEIEFNANRVHLIGIFQGSGYFAVIRDPSADNNGLRKVVVGSVVGEYTVSSILERQVTLAGEQESTVILRLFEPKASE